MVKALSVSMLNQIVSGGANFAFGVLMVRILLPAEFGYYGIGYAIILLFSGVGNALFLTQMVVNMPDKKLHRKADYAARILLMVVLLGIFFVTLFASGFWLIGPFFMGESEGLGLSLSLACMFALVKEFFVRYSYSVRRELYALIVNLSWAFILGLGVALFWLKGGVISSNDAFAMLSIAGGGAGIVGLCLHRLPLATQSITSLKQEFWGCFEGGRWAIGGVLVTWVQSQAYLYVSLFFIGPIGVALANASKILISPFSFLLPAINQVVLPRLADARNENKVNLFWIGKLYLLIVAAMALFYAVFLVVFLEGIVKLLLGEKYEVEQVFYVVIAWASVLVFQVVRNGAGVQLQALKAFRSLMISNIFSASICVVATFYLADIYGVAGAVLGTGLGELVLGLLLWRVIGNERKKTVKG